MFTKGQSGGLAWVTKVPHFRIRLFFLLYTTYVHMGLLYILKNGFSFIL